MRESAWDSLQPCYFSQAACFYDRTSLPSISLLIRLDKMSLPNNIWKQGTKNLELKNPTVLSQIVSFSVNSRLRLLTFKTRRHLHYSGVKLHKIFPSVPSKCDNVSEKKPHTAAAQGGLFIHSLIQCKIGGENHSCAQFGLSGLFRSFVSGTAWISAGKKKARLLPVIKCDLMLWLPVYTWER